MLDSQLPPKGLPPNESGGALFTAAQRTVSDLRGRVHPILREASDKLTERGRGGQTARDVPGPTLRGLLAARPIRSDAVTVGGFACAKAFVIVAPELRC